MHGMLLESASHFGQVEYGEEAWKRVMEATGCKNVIFNTHKIYPDELIPRMAQACADVLQRGDAADYMIFFGRCFVRYCSSYEEYEKMLRASARHFCQFLQEVDNVHSRMRFSYHKMKSPSMLVTAYDSDGAILQYRSGRKGFTHYLIGQLLQIANDFYSMMLEVSVIGEGTEGNINIVNLRLDFDNSAFLAAMQQKHLDFRRRPLGNTTLGKLLQFFPFGVVMDKNMILRLAGEKLIQLMGKDIVGKHIYENFKVRRPNIEISWQVIKIYGKVAWEVDALINRIPDKATLNKEEKSTEVANVNCSLHPVSSTSEGRRNLEGSACLLGGRRRSHRSEWVEQHRRTPAKEEQKGLLLKGQMYIVEEHRLAIFLSMPLLSDQDEMEEMGLFLNDLSMHDLSREMVLRGWEHGSSLEIMYDRAEANSNKLEESLLLLEQWKRRGDDLLYSMLPRQVAERLRQGKDPITTCKTFDEVSVLFAEAKHDEDSVNRHALDIVKSVNSTFSLLDSITEQYQVFKVETVGGVYMVVGGAPEPHPDHSAQVAALSLHIIKAVMAEIPCKHTIRIGIHIGPVVAGVVGNKLPRYCLFGDTVNTAARMLTNGSYGRVHITERCAKILEGFGFKTTLRGKLQIKGKGEMNTYWLEGDDTDFYINQPSEKEDNEEEEEEDDIDQQIEEELMNKGINI